jgi:hypothetical protein
MVGRAGRNVGKAVPLQGGIEIEVVRGPVMVGRDYTVQGLFLAKGATPKSEYLWWESELRDADSGKRVARMLIVNRWMKATSDLWR